MNRCWPGLPKFALLIAIAACSEQRGVRVQIEAHQPLANQPHLLELQAQVTGPSSGLQYKWFSGVGEFDPQESYSPKTSYLFGPNSAKDRVWVEVWRERERVAMATLDLRRGGGNADTVATATPPDLQIAITDVPRYDPGGGPDTRDDIAGKVTGKLGKGYSVVIYARADAWYIQPVPYALHAILPDKTWKSWTHTGSDYAVLVVPDNYKPVTRLDVLPPVEGDVFARTIIEGKKQ